MTESVIAFFEIEDRELKSLEFMPVELGFGMKHSSFGWPRKATENSILSRFSEMSKINISENGKVQL